MDPKNITVLYHADCSDGFGAAWAAWKKFGNDSKYIAVRHRKPPPNGLNGRDIIVADFAYDRNTLVELEKQVSSILILDHHKSAQADLIDYPNAIFDMNRSGAGITWDHLHTEQRPFIIDCIEDRDLWNWKIKDSRAILAIFDMIPTNFLDWDRFACDLEKDDERRAIIREGKSILKYKNSSIDHLLKEARRSNIGGYNVPILNSPTYRSELGNRLAKNEPFAAVWYQCESGDIYVSLRSEPNGQDVSLIAKKFGGGGHYCSSSFVLADNQDIPDFIKTTVN